MKQPTKQNISDKMGGDHHTSIASPPLISTFASQHSPDARSTQMPKQALDLLDIEFPIFEEATQTASHLLHIPICILGIPNGEVLVLKSATGLSRLGLMNPLARTRRLPLEDELASHVLREKQRLVLPEVAVHQPFTQSFLVQKYRINAYLGVPLLTAEGICIGLLAAMDVEPHDFSPEAIAFMELLARWSVSEYERYYLAKNLGEPGLVPVTTSEKKVVVEQTLLDTVRLVLMSKLTQEMRNPLTTITGMASMLSREIYGTLSPKQREYAEIVFNRSQVLLEMTNEVLELSSLGTSLQPLNPTSVDFEMLGQHVQKVLLPIAQENNQEIRLTVEPGSRLWMLDKDIVRQLLHYLIFSIIKLSGDGGTVRVHGSEREDCLNIAIWISHPWLGEGLSNSVVSMCQFLSDPEQEFDILSRLLIQATGHSSTVESSATSNGAGESWQKAESKSREVLSLLLSRYLIQHHGGSLTLQGDSEAGYRFLIVLPSA